jgi:hypothetical protein
MYNFMTNLVFFADKIAIFLGQSKFCFSNQNKKHKAFVFEESLKV